MLHDRKLFLSEVFDGILPSKVVKNKAPNPVKQTSDEDENSDISINEKDLLENLVFQEYMSDSSAVDSAGLLENSPNQKKSDNPKPNVPVTKKTLKNRKTQRELIREIIQHKYLVAEYYYLDLGRADSAKVIFGSFLSEYQSSYFAPKAALSLGLLNETVYHDSSAADSFYNIVVNRYPNSPSLIEASRRLNRSKSDNANIVNPANKLYERAYYEGFINKDFKAAYALTSKIQTDYPSSDTAARAAFLKASIVDQMNQSPDSSLSEYNRVIKLYPKTIYAKEAKEKVKRIKFLTAVKEKSEDIKGQGNKDKKKFIK